MFLSLAVLGGGKVKADHIRRFTVHDFPISHLVFQNEAKNIPNKDFVMMNISCKYEISTCNTLCSEEATKLLAESSKMPMAAILFFKMRPKIFQGKIL